MTNPLSKLVPIPWVRGGSVNCRLNLEGLFAAEMDLNIPIISPSTIPFSDRPTMVQMTCYLYAMYSTVPELGATKADCQKMLSGQKASYIIGKINELLPGMTGLLQEYASQFQPNEPTAPAPLVDADGGPANGPTP